MKKIRVILCTVCLMISVILSGCNSNTQTDNEKNEHTPLIMADGNLYYWTEETDCIG